MHQYSMKDLGCLNLENPTDLFCLHYIYLPRINRTLEEFKAAYNNHSVSSEGNRNPLQLFSLSSYCLNDGNPQSTTDAVSVNYQREFIPLRYREMQELSATINPLENDNDNGKTLFQRTQEFIYNKLVNMNS